MAADTSDDRVELTDLDVITRFSLAVRSATADRQEVIAAMRADLAWLENGRRSGRAAAKKTPAKPGVAKKTPAKPTAAKKPAVAKSTPVKPRSKATPPAK